MTDLAKELKEAGFPQKWREGMSFYDVSGSYFENGCSEYNHEVAAKDGVKVPTLSELIEACGEMLDALANYHNGFWCARHPDQKFNSPLGRSPEEAVARLWLALNAKK